MLLAILINYFLPSSAVEFWFECDDFQGCKWTGFYCVYRERKILCA